MPADWKKKIAFVALAAFVAGIMFAAGCLAVSDFKGNSGQTGMGMTPARATEVPGVGADTIADIVSKAGPAVVKIDTVKISRREYDPLWDDPFFRQFFGGGLPQTRQERGLGTGFIISPDGYILTNEHVIDGASQITVTMLGRDQKYQARVVGSDYDLDLAVLKIDAGNDLPTLNLGDSDRVRVGNWVIAIGNPYGFDHTVTVGVISATGRPIDVGNRHYKNLLQTDASINPGNSGGPLLNLAGEVVGINTAVAQAQGIGFAIPSNTVKQVLDDLINKGMVVRPWMGVQLSQIDRQVAEYLGLSSLEGALVVNVIAGSPAEKAGLKAGDVILQFNGQKVTNPDQLVQMVRETKVGQQVTLLVYRNGQYRKVNLVVSEKPAGY